MKITDVELITASYPTDDVPPTRRSFAVLRVDTDDGLTGWGEASDCYGHRFPRTLETFFDEVVRWLLVGRDPMDLEHLGQRLRDTLYGRTGARELAVEALSAIDIALWDIRGKALGVSVSRLLGRRRDRVPLYAAGKPALTATPQWNVEFLQPLLDRGVKAAKVRTGRDLSWDEAMVREVASLLPDDVEMFVDGKYNYHYESALHMARVLGELGAHAFEEPIQPTNLAQVRRLGEQSPVPLAYGEHAFTVHDFRDLLEQGGVRILEPDVAVCGGFTEGRKVLTLAEALGARVLPHNGGLTAVGMAANLQFVAAFPQEPWLEYDARPYQPLRDETARGAPFSLEMVKDGALEIPDGPGLGIEFDEAVLRQYPYEIDEDLAGEFGEYTTPHV